jgi:hypothetical protein
MRVWVLVHKKLAAGLLIGVLLGLGALSQPHHVVHRQAAAAEASVVWPLPASSPFERVDPGPVASPAAHHRLIGAAVGLHLARHLVHPHLLPWWMRRGGYGGG